MKTNKINDLHFALLVAKVKASELNDIDDGGTSNMDTPVIFLPEWNKSDIAKAFESTGLIPSIHKGAVFILRACDGQGYRRTAMAEAFRDSLRTSGYNSAVDYRMD